MKEKLFKSTSQFQLYLWQVICLVISVLFYIAIIENRSPNFLRQLSVSLRTSFGGMMLITTLVIYLAYRIPGKVGYLVSMSATLVIFAMPLAGSWVSGHTQSILLSGLIPVSDAVNYYIDALRIQNGTYISAFSGMRPLFPGFLSFLLSITGRNFMSALGILTALTGIATFFATREIQKTHGTEPAVFFLILMFLYFRHHSGTTLSESLGVPVSLLGVALLWQGKNADNEWVALLGLFTTTFALNIRPGAMFVLPAILFWGGWYFRGNRLFSTKFFLRGIVSIAIAFLINKCMVTFLAGSGSVAFSNFSWAFYGLASGGNSWIYIHQMHPEIFLLGVQEQNQAILKLAIELILQDPTLVIEGAIQHWKMFFSSTWYNAYSFVAGSNFIVNEIARWGIYFLCMIGFAKLLLDRKDAYARLVSLAALGILVSVPFVPPTDAYRVRLYAATIPIFGLLPAMGLAYLRDRFNVYPKIQLELQSSNMVIPLSILLLSIILIAPVWIKINGYLPEIKAVSCPSGMDLITIQYDPDTYVNVKKENTVFLDWMPNFHFSNFRRNIHNLADTNFIQVLESTDPPFTLFYALDLQTNKEALVIIKTDELPKPGRLISICGEWDQGSNTEIYRIFHADFVAE